SVNAVAIHPDGARILTGAGDDTAKLWRIGEDAPLQTFEEHEGSVNAVAIHPDGARILTGAVVCLPESGPLFELVPASDMELKHGQEIEA
ncbi:MAG: hypothetical protein AAFQ22_16290, partial [Pseudomonadota bacterium]